MTARLTPNWTPSAAEAFGASGVKGRQGELLVLNKLLANGIDVQDFEEERLQQIQGVDIQTPAYSIDVKTNLNDREFYIEVDHKGWLFDSLKISDIILHVDIQTNECVWYFRQVAQSNLRVANRLVKITPKNFRSDFMFVSWDDLVATLKVDK